MEPGQFVFTVEDQLYAENERLNLENLRLRRRINRLEGKLKGQKKVLSKMNNLLREADRKLSFRNVPVSNRKGKKKQW